MFSVLNFLFPSILFFFIPVIALKVVFPNNSFFLLQNSRRDNNRFCRSNLRPRRNFESSLKCPHNCEPWEYCSTREENTPAPKIYLPAIHGPEPHITHPNTTFIYREEYGYPRNHPLHHSVSWFHFNFVNSLFIGAIYFLSWRISIICLNSIPFAEIYSTTILNGICTRMFNYVWLHENMPTFLISYIFT